METYLKVMLCIWVTLSVLKLSIHYFTIKSRYAINKELLDRLYCIETNISKSVDYYERDRGYK